MTAEKEVFEYLEELRKSGVTNMMGASGYIVNRFNMPKNQATNHLINWMSSKEKKQ
jgi:hypothetical protein